MSAYTIDLLVMGSLTLIFLMKSFFKKNVCKNLAFIRIIFVKEVNITKSLYCVCLVKFFFYFPSVIHSNCNDMRVIIILTEKKNFNFAKHYSKSLESYMIHVQFRISN